MEEYKILKSTENPFPDDLEGRINAIANVCNSEVKIATLLHLDDTPADCHEILERLRETVGGGFRLSLGNTFSDYCRYSLLPVGAVVEEQVKRLTDESIYTGYKISKAGKIYGVPLGVFSLQWAVDNGLSLYSILGKTGSPTNSRAPLNRLKILRLLRQEELREADLRERMGLQSNTSVRNHLKYLKRFGFISYDSIPEPSKIINMFRYKYTGKEGEPEQYKDCPKLTKDVFEFIKGMEYAGYHEISDKLSVSPNHISGVLSHLEKQGFLERVGEFRRFRRDVRSYARINDIGKKFVDGFCNVWNEALNGGSILNELQNRAEEFFDNHAKEYLIRGIENYRKVSPRMNANPIEETNERILAYLKEHPGARPRDISTNIRLSFVSKYLKSLVKSGILEKRKIDEKNKTAVGYFVRGN